MLFGDGVSMAERPGRMSAEDTVEGGSGFRV